MANEDFESELDQIDIPAVVTREQAKNILEDLEEKGRFELVIEADRSPKIMERIRWQLENDQPLLEFTEDYDAD